MRRGRSAGAVLIAAAALAVTTAPPAGAWGDPATQTASTTASTTASAATTAEKAGGDADTFTSDAIESAVNGTPAATTTTSEAEEPTEITGTCPAVFGLGVEGTGGSREDAPRDADTGALGQLFAGVFNHAGADDAQRGGFQREYIPYNSGMGVPGWVHSDKAYRDSVDGGIEELERRSSEILAQCPDTKLYIAGYSQGGDVAGRFLASVGSGNSSVPAEAIAGGALFGSPTRDEGMTVYAGTQNTVPDAVPGTDGEAVAGIPQVDPAPVTGAGPLPKGDRVESYGALEGRVAEWCAEGDIVCSMPEDAPLARAVAKVGSELTLSPKDPVSALTMISDSMALVPAQTAVEVVNEDIHGETLDSIDYVPTKSISQRLEDGLDTGNATTGGSTSKSTTKAPNGGSGTTASTLPRTLEAQPEAADALGIVTDSLTSGYGDAPSGGATTAGLGGLSGIPGALGGAEIPGLSQASAGGAATLFSQSMGKELNIGSALLGPLAQTGDASNPIRAIAKLGILGVNAATTIAATTLTPQTIAQVASVGLTDPAAGLAVLSAKAAGAAAAVLIPAGINGAGEVVDLVRSEVSDNQGLLEMATNVNYWAHGAHHMSYGQAPFAKTGESAMEISRQWIAASVSDISAGGEMEEASELSSTSESSMSESSTSESLTSESSTSESSTSKSSASDSQAGVKEPETTAPTTEPVASRDDDVLDAAETTPAATVDGQ